MQNIENDLKIEYIEIDKVRPNPYQPRQSFDKGGLDDLASSIRQHGLMQPITVRGIGDMYELVAGERRLKASKLIGLKEIPAIISDITNEDSAVLALIENLQRENLNFIEESQAYYNLIKEHGYTQQQLAKSIGKNQSTVANKLRLLKLPDNIIDRLVKHNLSERHARALLRLPDKKMQVKVLNQIIAKELNVKRTEEMIDKILIDVTQKGKKEKEKERKMKMFLKDIRLLTNTITQAVDIIKQSGVNAKYTMKDKPDSYEINIKIQK